MLFELLTELTLYDFFYYLLSTGFFTGFITGFVTDFITGLVGGYEMGWICEFEAEFGLCYRLYLAGEDVLPCWEKVALEVYICLGFYCFKDLSLLKLF